MKETALKKTTLKLFVVGEASGDPDQWSPFSNRSFVLARTPEEALKMAGSSFLCAEVDCSQPVVLCRDEGCSELSNFALLLQAAGVTDGNTSERPED